MSQNNYSATPKLDAFMKSDKAPKSKQTRFFLDALDEGSDWDVSNENYGKLRGILIKRKQ